MQEFEDKKKLIKCQPETGAIVRKDGNSLESVVTQDKHSRNVGDRDGNIFIWKPQRIRI